MEKFAFIIHPIEAKRDVARKGGVYRIAGLPFVREKWVEWAIKKKDPVIASKITGIRSLTGAEAEGWFIACPLTPRQFVSLPYEFVLHRLIQCGELAESLGAGIIGLGAFTSVAGDSGVSLAKKINIAVTTGNSYTVGMAVEGAFDAARRMKIDLRTVKAAVVGATGSIGRTCARLLAPEVAELALIGRNLAKLSEVSEELSPISTRIYTDVQTGLRDAGIVITVTSAVDTVIEPADLASGAVVCDVARPRDVSERVARERSDVLVIEGGVVSVPGDVNFNFNFGFGPRTAYACMSETMILALERRYESFTLGKDVSVSQVREITDLGRKHGFKLAGYRSFEHPVSDETIDTVLSNVNRIRKANKNKNGSAAPISA